MRPRRAVAACGFPRPRRLRSPAAASQPAIPADQRRASALRLPEVSELDLLRHFNRLSHLNHAIDLGFYPLGSCTMKYNPKVNEWAARLPGLADSHPLDPGRLGQGSLELEWLLAELLKEISGLAAVSLQPAAGAQGELTGMLMTRAYHRSRGEGEQRTKVLVPDSAHGTNPATASMVGYQTVTIRSNERGGIDLDALRGRLGPDSAALMITNPSTLGHLRGPDRPGGAPPSARRGRIAYMDGANLNAILGRFRPGDAGFDVMHFNLHKTFSTPHGGGGPGAGPVGVSERLAPFLPAPMPRLVEGDAARSAQRVVGRSTPEPASRWRTSGRPRASAGCAPSPATSACSSAPIPISAATATPACAGQRGRGAGRQLPPRATGRCLRPALRPHLQARGRLHAADARSASTACTTLDIAKAILDHGIHPPTIYFPLIVEEALMIEPTETESLETLDRFAEVMLEIAEAARTDPEALKRAPLTTPVGRLDEATAARRPDLRHNFGESDQAEREEEPAVPVGAG